MTYRKRVLTLLASLAVIGSIFLFKLIWAAPLGYLISKAFQMIAKTTFIAAVALGGILLITNLLMDVYNLVKSILNLCVRAFSSPPPPIVNPTPSFNFNFVSPSSYSSYSNRDYAEPHSLIRQYRSRMIERELNDQYQMLSFGMQQPIRESINEKLKSEFLIYFAKITMDSLRKENPFDILAPSSSKIVSSQSPQIEDFIKNKTYQEIIDDICAEGEVEKEHPDFFDSITCLMMMNPIITYTALTKDKEKHETPHHYDAHTFVKLIDKPCPENRQPFLRFEPNYELKAKLDSFIQAEVKKHLEEKNIPDLTEKKVKFALNK